MIDLVSTSLVLWDCKGDSRGQALLVETGLISPDMLNPSEIFLMW